MPSHKKLTPEIKAQVVQAGVAKKTYRAIAEQFNIAISSLTYIMKQFKATGDVNRRPTVTWQFISGQFISGSSSPAVHLKRVTW
jgi:transposase-like protein